ncbi:MAG: phytoene desaturase family protein [Blastocatellia bacterium]
MNKTVIVVGGGLAGLTAANFAADAGCNVTLFEKSHIIGGRAMTSDKNGVKFNLGPHALYRGGQAIRILRELGVPFHGDLAPVSQLLAIKNGNKQKLPADGLSLMTTKLFGISAKVEGGTLLTLLPKFDAAKYDRMSLREWLAKEVRNDDLRQLLQALFRLATYANEPDRQSAGVAVAQLQMALKESVIYLDGGWQTLADGLRARAEQAGVKIIAESMVANVEVHNRRAIGVRLADGLRHSADAIILAVSPAEASDLIEDGEQTEFGKWAENSVPVKAACLDIALERLPDPSAVFALGIDRPLYFSVHSSMAKLAPAGKAVIHVAMYLASNADNDPKAIEQELEALLDLVQPGWRTLVIERRFLSKITVVNSLVTAEHGGLSARPKIAAPDIERLFLAGDWVGAEGWLADASVASGKRAAELASRAW